MIFKCMGPDTRLPTAVIGLLYSSFVNPSIIVVQVMTKKHVRMHSSRIPRLNAMLITITDADPEYSIHLLPITVEVRLGRRARGGREMRTTTGTRCPIG